MSVSYAGRNQEGGGRLTQVVQGEHGPDDRRKVDDDTLIVDTRPERLAQIHISSQLRQKPDHLLQLVNHLMVDWQFTVPHGRQVLANLR